MKLIINLLLVAIAIPCFAQKKLVDNETPKNWEKLETYQISDNGKYVWYKQRSNDNESKVVLISSDGKFKKNINAGSQARFTEGGKYFICNYHSKDSTEIIGLDKMQGFVLKGRNYKTVRSKKDDLIACQSGKQLTIMNLKSGNRHSYNNIASYVFSPDGSTLMLAMQTDKENTLVSLNTESYEEHIINKVSVEISCFALNSKTYAYLTKDSIGNKLWVYSLVNKTNKQVILTSVDNSAKISEDMLNLSPDGKTLYFNIEKRTKQPEPNVITDKLTVWSYMDEYPQSSQSLDKSIGSLPDRQTVAYQIESSRIIPITDHRLKLAENGRFNNRYLLLINQINKSEAYYRRTDKKFFLMDVETGEKKLVAVNPSENRPVEITSDERYVIWYDLSAHKYFSHEIQSGINRDLSGTIPHSMDNFRDPRRMSPAIAPHQYSLVKIGSQGERLIVGDEFDLWELDPSCKRMPISLTGGVGRHQGIEFRIILGDRANNKKSVLVEAFNTKNKDNGIFSLVLNERSELKLKEIIPMQTCNLGWRNSFKAQIASNADVFLVAKQKSNESPNIYIHSEVKTIKLTNFYPENEYNWFTSELHNYKLTDGANNQGILYKPENFDPKKKYPVIFYYYQWNSFSLNAFIEPSPSYCLLTIPWYVSNGYLVFVPDVTHELPNPGDRIYDCIISAANHVAALPYVDAKYMGLQGHSYGGYETNLMITKSKLFAAAQSSSGLSDYISHVGTPVNGGFPGYYPAEAAQLNMPGTPWDYQDLYIKDSPVFHADKVTTPLLLMHGTEDGKVLFGQSLEMYFALRRLSKPVWLLEYENEGHTLVDENNIQDFNIRMQQFFDHFLKGKPMPVWMSRGIPSWEKRIKSGLELDTAQETR